MATGVNYLDTTGQRECKAQEPAASANLDVRAIKNEPIGLRVWGLIMWCQLNQLSSYLLDKLINIRFFY
jgi:hypothetical protein